MSVSGFYCALCVHIPLYCMPLCNVLDIEHVCRAYAFIGVALSISAYGSFVCMCVCVCAVVRYDQCAASLT